MCYRVVCYSCLAPTGPPRNPNGTRVTTTLINVNWLPPEPIHVNGIIDHYVIRVREVYTGRVFSLLSEDENILVGPLHPNYVYSCRIAAYTVGLGPFGPPFLVQAGETGRCRVLGHTMYKISLVYNVYIVIIRVLLNYSPHSTTSECLLW